MRVAGPVPPGTVARVSALFEFDRVSVRIESVQALADVSVVLPDEGFTVIAGGSGAGPDFDGTSAVQTHMTNSRLTDPEVLESRFPVLLEEFSIRRGSGGAGAHRGGDGTVRRVRFLEPLTASILSNHRRVPPFGVDGGEPGAVGVNRVERQDGRTEDLPSTARADMAPGDVFVIKTPGGGGYGKS